MPIIYIPEPSAIVTASSSCSLNIRPIHLTWMLTDCVLDAPPSIYQWPRALDNKPEAKYSPLTINININ